MSASTLVTRLLSTTFGWRTWQQKNSVRRPLDVQFRLLSTNIGSGRRR
ncbi:hypothetical protein EPIRMAN_GEN20615_02635 [Ralstonia mannitolilytica]